MGINHRGPWACLAICVGLASCAGNGDGLDQNGQPLTASSSPASEPITADLASIEAHVFTPICSKCHIGASAPEGLQLDAAHAYALLVGVPSAEEPSLQRIDPGNPDASYLVLKIEGAPGIEGSQMPLGETPLPEATIDAIRQWVTNGAPNVPGAAPAKLFAVEHTVPSDQSTVIGPLPQVIVTFTHEVDASVVNETTVMLERLASEESTEANSTAIPIALMVNAANPAVLLLRPNSALPPGGYRVTLRGRGGGAIADLNATTLPSDTAFQFTVEAAP